MMATAVSADGVQTETLFASIISADANARILQELPDLVITTEGLKTLEWAGHTLVSHGTQCSFVMLSDYIAGQNGLPVQAVYAFVGLVAAALWGAMKYHLLLEQGTVDQVPMLLSDQWVAVKGYMNDALAISMRFDSATEFADAVPGQLRVLSGRLKRAREERNVTELEAQVQEAVIASSIREQSRDHWGVLMIMLLGLAMTSVAVCALAWLRPDVFDYVVKRVKGAPPDTAISAVPASASVGASIVARPPASESQVASVASGAVSASASMSGASTSSVSSAASTPTVASMPVAATEPASQVSATPSLKDTRLVWHVNRIGAPTLEATVANESEKAQLIDVLNRKPIAGHFAADITVDANTKRADWLAHMGDLLQLLMLPGVDVTISGDHVELGGVAADERLGWRNYLVTRLGSSYHINDFNVDQAVAMATTLFDQALDDRHRSGDSCVASDVTKVLMVQVVDFAKGSGRVPAAAVNNLSKSARLLKACAESGKPVKLEIAVFSDNTGEPRANLDLSKKRAEAVRTLLVEAGVPANTLSARGYGSANPVADNLTSRGRFSNRRIEFIATQ